MKKYFKCAFLFFIFFAFFSCASTPKESSTIPESQPNSTTSAELSTDNTSQKDNSQITQTPTTQPTTNEKTEDLSSQESSIETNNTPDVIEEKIEDIQEETFEIIKVEAEDQTPQDVPEDQLVFKDVIEEEILPVLIVEEDVVPASQESTQKPTEISPSSNENTSIKQNTETNTQSAKTVPDENENKETQKNDAPTAPVIAEENNSIEEIPEQPQADPFTTPAVIRPSRSVTVKNNQYLDVSYPGNGWIYIGETQRDPLFTYFGRKLAKGDTTFSLRSKKSGQTVLHFYKNDPLTGEYIDDYLDVTVENESAKSNTRTQAPSYAQIVPPKPEKRGVTFFEGENTSSKEENITSLPPKNDLEQEMPQSYQNSPNFLNSSSTTKQTNEKETVKTVIQNTQTSENTDKNTNEKLKNNFNNEENVSETTQVDTPKQTQIPTGNLLEEAKKAYSEKKYEDALLYIQLYLDSASTKIDEALYVQGQILEADSPVKNIRSALDSYNAVVNRYPSSRWWKKSNERSIYLKRFYIDIR